MAGAADELEDADFDEAEALDEEAAEDELAVASDGSETSEADIAEPFESGALDC